MKKAVTLASTLIIVAMLAACGNTDKSENNGDKKETAKTTTSQAVKEKKNTEKKADSDKQTTTKKETSDKDNKSDQSTTTGTKTPTTKKEDPTKETPAKKPATPKDSSKTTKGAFSLSPEGFKVSNVAPILGGNVTNIYVNSDASFVKIFRNLTITINQVKAEKLTAPTKKAPASDPQSYLNGKNGYVVTLDVSIQNRSNKDVIYKANEISLMNASKSVGGSLDNFVPDAYKLVGSKKDPFVFAPHKTARGLVTFTMDEATYDSIKNNTKIGVLNPDDFDNTLKDKDDDIVVPYNIH